MTRLAALKFVESHGGSALPILEGRAELADARGHTLAARTWRRLAAAARHALDTLEWPAAALALSSLPPADDRPLPSSPPQAAVGHRRPPPESGGSVGAYRGSIGRY